jgi:DNA-binding response OmpR family regulator
MAQAPEATPDRRIGGAGATILVVEDDPRVVELLHIALGAHGFRVISAQNGDDAWRMLVDEQPDLAVLDVRLPRRSGLDLVDMIRREASIANLPIILVSALAETESRVAGLARGADDYLAKPFSPKELVARVRRLLVRGEEGRVLRRRQQELVAEVDRSREDLKRLNQELRKQLWLREAFLGLSQDLSHARRVEDVASTFLLAVVTQLEVPGAALLVPVARAGEHALVAVDTPAYTPEAFAKVSVEECGELVRLVAGLARPVRREELERFPELARELRPLVAAGVALCIPLVTRGRLVGMALALEKLAGEGFDPGELEIAQSLAAAGATALDNTRLYRQAEETYLRALGALLPAVEALDAEAGRRARGTAELAASLGRELGLPDTSVEALRADALAHAVAPTDAPWGTWTSSEGAALEREILSVAEAYFAYVEGQGPGQPAPDGLTRFFEQSRSGRGFDRQVTQALDDLLRRGSGVAEPT